jgi:hypothetical protein
MSAQDDRSRRDEGGAAEEPFLSRWSRLKQASRAPAPPQAEGEDPQPGPPAAEQAGERQPHEAGAEDAGTEVPELPSLDSLTEESDFAPFMKAGVDPEMRRQALRKMFRNPKYAAVDPLDPYRTDFAAFTSLGDTVTADMKYHAERLLRKKLDEALAASDDESSPAAEAGSRGAPAGAAAAGAAAPPPDEQVPGNDTDSPAEDGDERRDA